MNIAIVSQGRSHLINLARELDKNKIVEVTFYTMMPRSRCKKFGYDGKVVSCLFPIGVLSVLIEKIPFLDPYRRSCLRIRLRLFFDKWVSWQLRECDVLIGLNGTAVKTSLRSKKYGAIAICDQGSSHILKQDEARRSYSYNEPPRLNTEYMLKHYDASDYLMTACEYVKLSDIEQGVSPDRIFVNPYGVDLNVFKPTMKPNDAESFDVIMVGAWWKHKGCDMLADACINKLRKSLLHVGAVIDCELPQSPLFKHIGFVEEKELPNYYAKAKVFAMPSLDEGFGLVLLQAAACGLPTVASTRTGGPDMEKLLGNPQGCLTIEEPLSADTIAIAIQKALTYAESLPEGPRVQYKNEINNISWEAYVRRYYEILKKLITQ